MSLESTIMSKLKAWSQTAEGKARISEKIGQYQREGVKKTAAGSKIATNEGMIEAATKLRESIISTALSYDLPTSVMNDIQSLVMEGPYETPEGWTVNLYFANDLSRESLWEEGYPEGISNIIALFNNGYLAGDRVYGVWKGHTTKRIPSKIYRTELRFLQQAVNDFNRTVGAQMNAEVRLAPIYEEVSSVGDSIF